MYKKITKIQDVNDFLKKGLVCLVQPKGEECYNFGYLTFNSNFINTCSPFDILKEKEINVSTKMLSGFYGEIFSIATMRAPNYSEYLKSIEFEDLTINFADPLYLIDGFKHVRLINVADTGEFPFDVLDDEEIISINEKGQDENGNWIVSNFKEDFVVSLFEEREGYIILSETAGPIYISKEKHQLINKLGAVDYSFLGVDMESDFKVFPVLQIIFDNEIVDTIILNTQEKPTSTATPIFEDSFSENDIEGLNDIEDDGDVFLDAALKNIRSIDENYEDMDIVFVDEDEDDNEEDWDTELSLDVDEQDDDDDWDDDIELEKED